MINHCPYRCCQPRWELVAVNPLIENLRGHQTNLAINLMESSDDIRTLVVQICQTIPFLGVDANLQPYSTKMAKSSTYTNKA